jgi:predicted dehydrogenase
MPGTATPATLEFAVNAKQDTKTYRVAIIGLGRMGSTIDDEIKSTAIMVPYSIAAASAASERLELVAGADLLADKRDAFRERWDVSALYADYQEMIEQERPDVVAICTKGELHAEMAVNVANAGVPLMFVEKAIACSVDEADAILNACRENGTLVNTGVLRRFDTRYHHAREYIERGDIGDLLSVVHFAPASLMHGHIHSIDTLMYLAGDPSALRVRGSLRPSDLEIPDNRLDADPQATFHIEFEGGVEGWTIPAGRWEFEVFGTEGSLRGMNNGIGWRLRKPRAGGEKGALYDAEYVPPEPYSATRWCLEDLVNAHEEGRETLGNVDVSHHATEICLAVAESHQRGGGWVELPLENRSLYVWHV